MWEDLPSAEQDETHERLAQRRVLSLWVARNIIPYEPQIRSVIRKARQSPEEMDELMQEAYCRISMLESVDHIQNPRAYFFSILKNLVIRNIKRSKIVSFEEIAEIESLRDSESPSTERQVDGRLTLVRIREIIAQLPETCRRAVELRKIEGWSQREIAIHLGISEKAVEKQIWLGVRSIRASWDCAQRLADDRFAQSPQQAKTGRGERP